MLAHILFKIMKSFFSFFVVVLALFGLGLLLGPPMCVFYKIYFSSDIIAPTIIGSSLAKYLPIMICGCVALFLSMSFIGLRLFLYIGREK